MLIDNASKIHGSWWLVTLHIHSPPLLICGSRWWLVMPHIHSIPLLTQGSQWLMTLLIHSSPLLICGSWWWLVTLHITHLPYWLMAVGDWWSLAFIHLPYWFVAVGDDWRCLTFTHLPYWFLAVGDDWWCSHLLSSLIVTWHNTLKLNPDICSILSIDQGDWDYDQCTELSINYQSCNKHFLTSNRQTGRQGCDNVVLCVCTKGSKNGQMTWLRNCAC